MKDDSWLRRKIYRLGVCQNVVSSLHVGGQTISRASIPTGDPSKVAFEFRASYQPGSTLYTAVRKVVGRGRDVRSTMQVLLSELQRVGVV